MAAEEKPTLEQLHRWLGGEAPREFYHPPGTLDFCEFTLGEPLPLLRLTLLVERFLAADSRRRRQLAQFCAPHLGRPLLPPLAARGFPTPQNPDPRLLGHWEGVGNLRLILDYADPRHPRLRGFSLGQEGGLGQGPGELEDFRRCWGGELRRFPRNPAKPLDHWLWYLGDGPALEAFVSFYQKHPRWLLAR